MQFYIGTSGYSYKEWQGRFYPKNIKPADMLRYYSDRFATVEINNTFYKLPKSEVIRSWVSQVPDQFRFTVKAPLFITHSKKLQDAEAAVERFTNLLDQFGEKLGAILFQLPPNLSKDLARLDQFLALLNDRYPIAFEFHHASWFDSDAVELLRSRHCSIVIVETAENNSPEIIKTTDWGYLRLRKEGYQPAELNNWLNKIAAQQWQKVFIFFRHEDTGSGPILAEQLIRLANNQQ